MAVFKPTELLIPDEKILEKWAVIACDQFTSQPTYWQEVRQSIGDCPSAYSIIFPEAELGANEQERISAINENMRQYLERDIFRVFQDSFVYVERTLLSGEVRRGLVGAIDLEEYDYSTDAISAVRATEQTVVERIPPRIKIRRGASLETSHVMMLMDDESGRILDSVEKKKEILPLLYNFKLMKNGGQIKGWLVQNEAADDLNALLNEYERETKKRFRETGKNPLLYAVGDGNHSLATAKSCWENMKHERPELAGTAHPARYAMVELQNIRDDVQKFEPIHRIIQNVSVEDLLKSIEEICSAEGMPIQWSAGAQQGTICLDSALGTLPVGVIQPFLDHYLKQYGGKIDYIHEEETALKLSKQEDSVAFFLPKISKDNFFRSIVMDGVLPRKTFSMGHAEEKRYYLECRRIVEKSQGEN